MKLAYKLIILFVLLTILTASFSAILVKVSFDKWFLRYVAKDKRDEERKTVWLLETYYGKKDRFPPTDEYDDIFHDVIDNHVTVHDLRNGSVYDYFEYSDNEREFIYTSEFPLYHGGKIIGKVTIRHRHSTLYSHEDLELQRMFTSGILISSIISIFLASFAGLIFSGLLLKPVRDMALAAEKVGLGDFSGRLNVKSRDELGSFAATFNSMTENLSRQENLRKKLTQNIAHELRTPLQIVQGSLEAFECDLIEISYERIRLLQEEIEGLAKLVDELQDLSLVESGQLKIEREPLDLRAIVNRVEEKVSPLFTEKGIELEVTERCSPCQVMLDPLRADHILTNIVYNSHKYTPPGGKVKITLEKINDEATIIVEDSGPGISPQDLPHVFERFYRSGETSTVAQKGMGLGLAIARELTLAQGGRIEINSSEKKGTEVLIAFPILQG